MCNNVLNNSNHSLFSLAAPAAKYIYLPATCSEVKLFYIAKKKTPEVTKIMYTNSLYKLSSYYRKKSYIIKISNLIVKRAKKSKWSKDIMPKRKHVHNLTILALTGNGNLVVSFLNQNKSRMLLRGSCLLQHLTLWACPGHEKTNCFLFLIVSKGTI